MKKTWLTVLFFIGIVISNAQTGNYKYDLYIDLHSIRAVKVDEGIMGDNDEDVWGVLGVYKITGVPGAKYPVFLWNTSYALKVSTEYIPFHIKALRIDGLTFQQLTSLSFTIGGDLHDDEPLIDDPDYYTINQNPRNRRSITFSDSNNRGEIEKMKPKPAGEYQYQIIKGGDNNYWEMDYYENGDNRRSHLRVRWQFSVVVKES